MLLNFLKGVAFAIFAAALMLGLAAVFSVTLMIGKASVLGIDLALIFGVFIAIPLAQAIFRRVSWLRFRGL